MRNKPVRSQSQLKKLLKWCRDNDITVDFSSKTKNLGATCLVPNEDGKSWTIKISSRFSTSTKINTILHEIGHIMIEKEPDYPKQFKYSCFEASTRSKKLRAHRIDVIAEECFAWNSGWKMAKKIGLKLDAMKWRANRDDCLWSYVKWANSKESLD